MQSNREIYLHLYVHCAISGRKNTSALLVRSAIISGKNDAFCGFVRPFCD